MWSNEEEVVLRGPPAFERSALERKAFAPLVYTHVFVVALGVSSDYETREGEPMWPDCSRRSSDNGQEPACAYMGGYMGVFAE